MIQLRRRAALVRLGVRFGRSERLSRWPIVAQVAASFVVVAALLVSVGVWNVVTERHSRAEARYPIAADQPGGESAQVVTRSIRTRAGNLHLVVVADGDKAGPPPGVADLPDPGDMVLSPAARQHIDELESILHYRDVGTVDEAGLLAPDELVAYVGVAASDFPSGPDHPSTEVAGFGGEIPNDMFRPDLVGFYRSFGGLVLLVGFGMVVRGAVRVSESLQERRLQALAALGLTATERRLVAGIRAATWSIVGAAAGVTAFYGVSTVSRIPFTSWSYFSADVGVGPVLSGLAFGATPLVAAVIAGLPAVEGNDASPSRGVAWRRLVLPVTVAAMWFVGWLPPGNSQRLAWWGAGAVVLAGLAFGTTELIRLTGNLLSTRDEPVARLAGRRMVARPGAHARLFAPVGLLILIGTVSVPIATATGARHANLWLDTLASNGRRIVMIGTQATIDFDMPYVHAAYPTLMTREDGEAAGDLVIVATCSQLVTVRVDTNQACPEGPLLATDVNGSSVFSHGDVTVRYRDSHQNVTIPAATNTMPISAHPLEQLEGRILVSPHTLGAPANRFEQAGYVAVVDPAPDTLGQLQAAIAAAAPTASVRSELDLQIGQTRALIPVSIGVRLASGVLILLLLLSASVAMMSEGLAAGRLHAPLKALGVPETFATRSYRYQMALSASITLLAAIACTAVTLNSLSAVWNAPTTPIASVTLFTALAGFAMLATGLGGLPFIHAPLSADALNLD